jgi:hypothetical protein
VGLDRTGDVAALHADIPAGAVLGPSDQPQKREEYDRADNRSNQAVNGDARQAEYPATDQCADDGSRHDNGRYSGKFYGA